MAEALAAKQAIQLATKLSLFKALVKGDCIYVVQALNALGKCLTLYGDVIEDARRIGSTLQSCSFYHVKREGHKLKHSLTSRAVLFADTNVWIKELPSDLDDVL